MEGPLSKWTNVMKGWQYRWFVLDDNAGLLSYYTSKEKMMRGSRRGCVRLCSANIGIDDEDDSTFTITVDQKVFHFQARDREEREQWVTALDETISRHSKKLFEIQPSAGALEDFDKKLAEADSYMKILIKNAKSFEQRINQTEDPQERQKYEGMQITTNELIEAVKQSIVTLQIAKTAIVPSEGSSVDLPAHSHNGATQVESIAGRESAAPFISDSLTDQTLVNGFISAESKQATSDSNVEIVREDQTLAADETPRIAIPEPVQIPVVGDADTNRTVNMVESPAYFSGSDIPPRSYSSSEDEDDDDQFFDADEMVVDKTDGLQPTAAHSELRHDVSAPVLCDHRESNDENADIPVVPTTSLDDMFMQEDEHAAKEGESVEEHKSVIVHLLSQVKLGMDLTKVVLPTFILERRSLLEMYADFFAHPDIFVKIADGATAKDRMINCLRWYLSSFHAGRKGTVAKKPYNPILGETFQCFYNLPEVPPDEYKVADGPVPWAHRNNVVFIAEQVSHHPPVSGFYAEHVNKKIQFNAHIWTKSKFLGLSIGVHNLGQGCVRLLDKEEEYILNFPSGYGRSILTVPWVELGGDCSITCEQTGYSANVTFHTKPFYGGKVHKISAEVFAPNEKKPFFLVEGEWNGIMFSKTPKGKSDCFIDTKKMSTVHKVVKKIEHQGEMESRRLWKEVTHNLKTNNIDEATKFKRQHEEKQRQDAKYRQQNEIKYETIHFKEDESGNWIYSNALINRG